MQVVLFLLTQLPPVTINMERVHVIVIAIECLDYEQISSYLRMFIIRTDSHKTALFRQTRAKII